jgi:tRNA(adenine34) deaminase
MSEIDFSMWDDESVESLIHGGSDEAWMRRALRLAEEAAEQDEVPVGAIIVHKHKIIGTGANQREQLNDPTAHAEMIAITQAAASLESWRLVDCTLYVTLEPCPMCLGACLNARVPRVVYAAKEPKCGACGSVVDLSAPPGYNHRIALTGGVLADESAIILKAFFRAVRERN